MKHPQPCSQVHEIEITFSIALQVICWKRPAMRQPSAASPPTQSTDDPSLASPLSSFNLPEPHCSVGEEHKLLHYPTLFI